MCSLLAERYSAWRERLAEDRLFRSFLCQLGDAGGARVRRAVLAWGTARSRGRPTGSPAAQRGPPPTPPPGPGECGKRGTARSRTLRRPLRDLVHEIDCMRRRQIQ